MNWVKQLFSSADRMFDILNIGRLIFYTSAGFLAVYPIFMIGTLLTTEPKGFLASIGEVLANSPGGWTVFFTSLVAGFLIAAASFTLILGSVFEDARSSIDDYKPKRYNFNFLYPFLRNDDKEEDYQSWLVAEYFRYVEIATFVPVGFLIGLGFMVLYSIVYILQTGSSIVPLSLVYPAFVFLLVSVTSFSVAVFHVWPRIWVPRVLVPVARTYFGAKIALTRGIEDIRKS